MPLIPSALGQRWRPVLLDEVEGAQDGRLEGVSRYVLADLKWASNMLTGMEKDEKKSLDDGEPSLNWRNRCGN